MRRFRRAQKFLDFRLQLRLLVRFGQPRQIGELARRQVIDALIGPTNRFVAMLSYGAIILWTVAASSRAVAPSTGDKA